MSSLAFAIVSASAVKLPLASAFHISSAVPIVIPCFLNIVVTSDCNCCIRLSESALSFATSAGLAALLLTDDVEELLLSEDDS